MLYKGSMVFVMFWKHALFKEKVICPTTPNLLFNCTCYDAYNNGVRSPDSTYDAYNNGVRSPDSTYGAYNNGVRSPDSTYDAYNNGVRSQAQAHYSPFVTRTNVRTLARGGANKLPLQSLRSFQPSKALSSPLLKSNYYITGCYGA